MGPGEGGREEALVHVVAVVPGDSGDPGVVTQLTQAVVRGGVAASACAVAPLSVMLQGLLLDAGLTGCPARLGSGLVPHVSAPWTQG